MNRERPVDYDRDSIRKEVAAMHERSEIMDPFRDVVTNSAEIVRVEELLRTYGFEYLGRTPVRVRRQYNIGATRWVRTGGRLVYESEGHRVTVGEQRVCLYHKRVGMVSSRNLPTTDLEGILRAVSELQGGLPF